MPGKKSDSVKRSRKFRSLLLLDGEVPERFPVLLDNVESPLGIGSIQAAKLVAWNGDGSSPTFLL
jgi:hypothetical protein